MHVQSVSRAAEAPVWEDKKAFRRTKRESGRDEQRSGAEEGSQRQGKGVRER